MSDRISLKQYCHQNGYNRVSKVRANVSGYKYITLIDANNGDCTENLYLGVRFSEEVEINDILPVNDLWVVKTTNANGETRYKLSERSGEVSADKLKDYQEI